MSSTAPPVDAAASAAAAAERKRKRLEAWRQKQQQTAAAAPAPPAIKIRLSLGVTKKRKKRPPKVAASVQPVNPFAGDDDEQQERRLPPPPPSRAMGFDLDNDDDDDDDVGRDTWGDPSSPRGGGGGGVGGPPKKRRRKRWDNRASDALDIFPEAADGGLDDALDQFMDKLQTGAMGRVASQQADGEAALSIDVSGSMMRQASTLPPLQSTIPVSGGVITPEELAQLDGKAKVSVGALYTHSDWESDANPGTSEPETEEEEESARRAFIEALKSAPVPATAEEADAMLNRPAQLAAEVKSEKHRREERLKELEREAEAARQSAEAASARDFGRLYNDLEGGVMEEAERNLDAAHAAPDALEVIAELNKKKELKAVDHSKIDYIPFKKNLYLVPRSLAALTTDEIADKRAKLKVKVRGQGVPAPVSTFEECGLSEKILTILEKQDISSPYPVQAQCLPCIMAGRDVIGIAKTGSGKTLAYLLPMFRYVSGVVLITIVCVVDVELNLLFSTLICSNRHIGDQPDLAPNESGPIGLILAPARELATQIQSVCKVFAKQLVLK
jgi:hypothetical protein